MGCRQAVRQRTLTPSSRGFESRQPSQKSSRAPCGPGWIFRECGIRTREGPSVKETSRWDVFSEERRDGPHTLACGSSSQQRFAETLVDPASPARGCTPGNSRSSPRWWSRISLPALLPLSYPSPAKNRQALQSVCRFLLLHYSRFTFHCLAGPIFGRE